MRRTRLLFVLAIAALATAAGVIAQTGGVTASGWEAREDRDRDISEGLSFAAMGTGVHANTVRGAGIFWRPADTHTGNYTIGATFTQMEPSNHPNAVGLFFGGADLSGDGQRYSYFVIREDGQFLIKQRAGDQTPDVVRWTSHAAINTLNASGRAKNTLSVDVGADQVRFLVNGTEVATQPRSAVDTEGISGLRVNHFLNVHIDDLNLGM